MQFDQLKRREFIMLLGVAAAWPFCARARTSGSIASATTRPPQLPVAAGSLSPACTVLPDQGRSDFPLSHTAPLLASGRPIKIVALGSSSTYGAGTSTSAAAYPSRLAEELARHFPGHEITVLNRGVNGEEITDMLVRLDSTVIADTPTWCSGRSELIRCCAISPCRPGRALARRADAPQSDRRRCRPDRSAICSEGDRPFQLRPHGLANYRGGQSEHIGIFHRFELMRHWYEVERLPFKTFVSDDGLHMNDWSYACLAKVLGIAIADAALRSR